MKNRLVSGAVLAFCLFLLAGCFQDSKADIIGKSDGISEKSELLDALGKPDEISKLGPIESWTYQATDGSVTFVITGDTVALSATD